jgi:adenylate kinase family enzyme
MGIAGSGKSTLAAGLADILQFLHFSGGAALRDRARQGDVEAQTLLLSGSPIPAADYEVLLQEALAESSMLILDGSPRSVEQVAILESCSVDQALGIFLQVPVVYAEKRLEARHRESGRDDDARQRIPARMGRKAEIEGAASAFARRWPLKHVDASQAPDVLQNQVLALVACSFNS